MPGTSPTPSATYYALDLEEREIQRTLTQVLNSDVGSAIQGKVEAKGMLGTYENGVAFVLQGGLRDNIVCDDTGDVSLECDTLQSIRRHVTQDTHATKPSTREQPQLHMLFLGSSLGNFSREDDADFLRSLPLRAGCGDTLLLGLDHSNGREEIEIAYNDPKGHTRNFIMNGLKAAGTALGDPELFALSNWEYTNFYDEGDRKCIWPGDSRLPYLRCHRRPQGILQVPTPSPHHHPGHQGRGVFLER